MRLAAEGRGGVTPPVGILADLELTLDFPADVVLLQRVLVDLRVGVDVPAGDVHDLGVLQPDDLELHGGFRNLRK